MYNVATLRKLCSYHCKENFLIYHLSYLEVSSRLSRMILTRVSYILIRERENTNELQIEVPIELEKAYIIMSMEVVSNPIKWL